ncbi:MAG: LysM peptidoglycan-binding domain-containing protein [Clostridia bacterium]|nr:LysM peptidoglycan-binding domain-containing protein [Clostridia bacterium]
MLKLEEKKLHTVRAGQTLYSIARAYQIPETAIIFENSLCADLHVGQVLILPQKRGNYYTAQAGDGPALLCGSKENYKKKNGTELLYPQMKVWL